MNKPRIGGYITRVGSEDDSLNEHLYEDFWISNKKEILELRRENKELRAQIELLHTAVTAIKTILSIKDFD